MIEGIIAALIKSSEATTSGVFLLMLLALFYYLRKDSKDHREEYKELVHQMFDVVNKNTESNQKLSGAVDELKERIKEQKA